MIANAVILHNVVDMTRVIRELSAEGREVTGEAVGMLSPYLTRHISRFGDYVIDMSKLPGPLEDEIELAF